jgi:hypothetical protein
MTHVFGNLILKALRKKGLNLPDVDTSAHEMGNSMTKDWRRPIQVAKPSPTLLSILQELDTPEPCGKAQPPRMPDPSDKRASREEIWRRQGWHELKRLVPFMKANGVRAEVVEHAEQLLAELTEEVHKKYPETRPTI